MRVPAHCTLYEACTERYADKLVHQVSAACWQLKVCYDYRSYMTYDDDVFVQALLGVMRTRNQTPPFKTGSADMLANFVFRWSELFPNGVRGHLASMRQLVEASGRAARGYVVCRSDTRATSSTFTASGWHLFAEVIFVALSRCGALDVYEDYVEASEYHLVRRQEIAASALYTEHQRERQLARNEFTRVMLDIEAAARVGVFEI